MDDRVWDTHGKPYLEGCKLAGVEPSQRIMEAVTMAAGGGKLQAQRTLEDFTVAKVPQWTKDGLMEHIVELVVVDDQVRKVTSFM
jgi:hypothetical protein